MKMKNWMVSEACGIGACIEIQHDGEFVNIRLTGDPETILRATAAEWVAFVAGAKMGQFDFIFPSNVQIAK
jgi:hypothetical protein